MVYYPSGIYFLTASTFLHYPYFKTHEQKNILYDRIAKLKENYDIRVCAYSIQINHYHLIIHCEEENILPKVKQFIHGGVGKIYREEYGSKYKDFWGSTKATHIKDLDMYWGIAGYVCGNLLKHKEVNKISDLRFNKFTSYGHFVEKYGEETMKEIIYKILKIDEEGGYLVDTKQIAELKLRYPG